jgi:hypothetical protein
MSSIFTYISAIYGLNGGKYSMQGAYEGYPHDVFPQKKNHRTRRSPLHHSRLDVDGSMRVARWKSGARSLISSAIKMGMACRLAIQKPIEFPMDGSDLT